MTRPHQAGGADPGRQDDAGGSRPAALVTGSAKGVGRAVLLGLAADGFDVAVHYRNSDEAAQRTAEEAMGYGVRAVTLRADVTVEAEARELVDTARQELGRLDVLVNNVGDYHHGPLAELTGETWRYMLDSNLNSTFYTCQQAVPHLRGSERGGRIVNIGYAGAEMLRARPGIVAYGIAKTGVILYSKALAKVEARHGLTVNVVSPGVMENSVTKPLDEVPMGRLGELRELVAAVRFLVSEEASYVTGVTLEVAGGWNL